MRIGFIGLGVMGFPMARHLASAGHELFVFNRSVEKSDRFIAAHGGQTAPHVAAAVAGVDALVLCVGNDDDVRELVQTVLPHLASGALIVDHTTTSAGLAQDMAVAAKSAGYAFVDAPVSGGQAGAEAGTLTAMLGGTAEDCARAAALIGAYCKAAQRIGEAGSGQLAKMCNQICIAGVVQGLAEAVHFAERANLDTGAVFEAISKGAAGSWQMQNRWPTMVEGRYDFGFAVDWMRKDLGLVLDAARANGARLEVTALVDQFYAEVQAMGGRRWDTSSLAARLKARRT